MNEIIEYMYASLYKCDQEINNSNDSFSINYWLGKKSAFKELLEKYAPNGKNVEE